MALSLFFLLLFFKGEHQFNVSEEEMEDFNLCLFFCHVPHRGKFQISLERESKEDQDSGGAGFLISSVALGNFPDHQISNEALIT